jgi:hypothetical protein
MMPGIKTLAAFLVAVALCTGSGQAAIVTMNLTAEITELDDRGGLFSGQINVGDIITGSYTYDSDTPDANPSSTVGDYWHTGPPYGINLIAGGFVFQTDPDTANVSLFIEIVNEGPNYDVYVLRSYSNLPVYDDVSVTLIDWQLNDYSGTAVSSDALPTTPPVLEDYPDTWVGLTMVGGVGDRYSYRSYFIRSTVTSVELVPAVEAEVEIHPATLNLQSRGKWITCNFWLPEDYNVAEIEPNSVYLEVDANQLEPAWIWFDEHDQVAMAKFSRQDVQDLVEPPHAELTLYGRLTDGTTFGGSDTIRVMDRRYRNAWRRWRRAHGRLRRPGHDPGAFKPSVQNQRQLKKPQE